MKKLLLIMIICILFLVSPFFKESSNDINGTYKSTTDSFISMSFDEKDNCTFYFYYLDNKTQKLDKGKYYHKDDNVFVINSSKFINQKINYKNNSFIITIDGVEHTFKKINNHPIIIVMPDS